MKNPYEYAAHQYMTSGLGWPIPSLMPFEKMPPLKGWTGKQGKRPDLEQIDQWAEYYPNSNVLLRLNPSVVGIDVDAYDEKMGGDTLRRVTNEHGRLPVTYKSSARGPGAAGIYFYRLRLNSTMDDRKLKGDFGPGSDIEVIRYSHRYAVVSPSWHQGAAAEYQWYDPNGNVVDFIPQRTDIPFLPIKWYHHMAQTCRCFEEQRAHQRMQIQRYKNRPMNEQGRALAEMDFERGIKDLALTPEGGRNNGLSKLAGRTLLFDVFVNSVLDLQYVIDQLCLAAATNGLDETEAMRTIESALEWATGMYGKDSE